jgi:hypothetical protein
MQGYLFFTKQYAGLCAILNAACKIKAVKCIALQEQQTDLGKSLENTEQRPQQGRDLK